MFSRFSQQRGQAGANRPQAGANRPQAGANRPQAGARAKPGPLRPPAGAAKADAGNGTVAPKVAATPANAAAKIDDDIGLSSRFTDLKVKMHQELLDMINLSVIDKMAKEEFRTEVGKLIRELLAKESKPLNQREQTQLINDILDEVLGLGPLEPLLKDETITDILVNGFDSVFIERGGRLHPTPVRFKDNRHLLRIIDKIVSAVGRRVDESQPMVDARLADGSRVNAIIPPLAVDGPLLSIRKFAKSPVDMEKLIGYGALPRVVAEVLHGIVQARKNVLISGGTGSGKTTMLNAMSAAIDKQDRIITIEDAAELQLQQIHVARLETRPPNIEGKGEVSQRELVKNALRMRPDRIIVGEVRGGEAFDMLQAMNTGHDGSMTTVHANTCRDALSRLEQMIGMTGMELPAKTMRAQIASALDVVLQLSRMSDGKRRLVSINEITGMEGEVVQLQEIFSFKREGMGADGAVLGRFVAHGIRPKFMADFEILGIDVSPQIFDPSAVLE